MSGASLLLVSCSDPQNPEKAQSIPASPHYGGTYRKPLLNEPPTLDPALTTDVYAIAVIQQLFDGLVQFDADLNVVPSIAKSWQASYDGLVWTFYLRSSVKFHHGREVKAEDFVYSFTRILASETHSPHTWLFEHIQGAKQFRAGAIDHVTGLHALDDRTLQITLSQPYAPFITVLGMAPAKVVPREEVKRLGELFGRRPIGTGPFRFGQWNPGKDIILHAYEAYFEGRPFLNHLHYKLFPGHNTQVALATFESTELEDTSIPAHERLRLRDDPRYRFVRKPILATLFLWIHTRESPLHHIKVRQAINYAVNREVINSTIRHNRFEQARGVLPLGMPGYNPKLAAYPHDVDQARQLLAEAGYPAGQGLPPLTLWTSVTSQEAVAEHEAIQRHLQQIGMTLELHTMQSWERFKTEILGKRPGALYRYAWHADFPDPDNFLFVLFHSQSPNNFAHYSNPKVDQLLEQAQRESDYLTRMALYRDTEALIMADAPVVPLVYYTFEHLFQPYVRGVELNALGEHHIPMKKIWLDRSSHGTSTLARQE
jgi:peptide/nickel transport system substrate-binding protein/oligopeptide transport system substrate-binding protein